MTSGFFDIFELSTLASFDSSLWNNHSGWNRLWGLELGAEFVVSFFFGSRTLALKSSFKSRQMTAFLIQNENWENYDFVIVKTSSFWIKEVVTWWLFDDDLRAREKRNHKFCS